MLYDDIERTFLGDVLVEKIKFPRATFKESKLFKEKLEFDILRNSLKIVIDLSECSYIDSTFLGTIVIVLKKMEERGGEIKFVTPQPSAMHLFRITGLYGILNFYNSIDEAVSSFG